VDFSPTRCANSPRHSTDYYVYPTPAKAAQGDINLSALRHCLESDLAAPGDSQNHDQENHMRSPKQARAPTPVDLRARRRQERLRSSSEARGTLTDILDKEDSRQVL
jgi:hypothetical protein